MTTPVADLVVELEASGRYLENIEEYQISSAFMTPADAFSFTTGSQTDPDSVADLELQPVRLFVEGNHYLTGRVDVTECGPRPYLVQCSGRDYIADILESNVDALKLTEGMTLDRALLLALAPLGINQISSGGDVLVRNIRTGATTRGSAPPDYRSAKLEDFKAEPGTNLWQFCEGLVSRHRTTIQPTLNRSELSLEGPVYDQESKFTIHRSYKHQFGKVNNVVEGTGKARRDFSKVFSYALFTGKGGVVGETKVDLTSAYSVEVFAAAYDELWRKIDGKVLGRRSKPTAPAKLSNGQMYRLLRMQDNEAKNQAQLDATARLEISNRLKDTLQYTVTVRGHKDPNTGAVYAPNTIATVYDEIARVDEDLWLEGVTLKHVPKEGPMADLAFWRKGVFQP